MINLRAIGVMVATLLIIALSGCASTAEEGLARVDSDDVEIQVQNNIAGLSGVTVHLVSPGGDRRFLGSLSGGGTTIFDVSGRAPGEYQLVAEAAGGRRIASRPFLLTEPGVRWNLNSNVVISIAA